MGFEKPRTDSRRQQMRNALRAAIASASLLGSDAEAAERSAAEAARASSWTMRQATKTEAPALREYLSLVKRMQGVYVDHQGPVASSPQFDAFCEEIAIFCKKFADYQPGSADPTFTPELFARIDKVNREVNAKIKPMADIKLYQTEEKWTVPTEAGDCEDYVLLKMIRLINEGVDPVFLHIMVVRDERDEGHAVLGVDVLKGGERNTIVLDNKYDHVKTLSEMQEKYDGYHASFIARSPEGELSVRFYKYISRDARER